jgi:hypothetical protein
MKVKNILLIGIAILSFIASSQAQNVNIPNAIFKEVLLGDTSINTNGDAHIQVSEASVFNGAINVSGLGITNLTGIEAFVLLDSLDCSFNAIDTLNLSANTALRYLDCSNNTYRYLCGNNDLTGLDVNWYYDDQYSYTNDQQDPSDPNYGLTCFVHSNPVFNFLNNEALTYLDCSNNNLISLNVSACTSLNYLNCNNNRLSSINLSDNTELTYLHCAVNYLTSLNVSACTDLTVLWCPYNQLPILNVSGLTALFDLDCSYNGLTSLNLLACTSLTYLDCFFNFLPSLNVSTNTALSYLNCVGNSLESIDLTANTALTFLNCGDNVLQSLNVSANTALTIMACAYNQLSSLNVSANTALTVLHCYNNLLTSLNVSACTELNALWCFDNLLTCLNVKNGTNLNHGYLYTYNNNLNCIEVDDFAWSADNWVSMSPEDYLDNYYQGVIYYGLIDSSASFSLNCSSTAISYSSSSFCQSNTTAAVNRIGAADGTYTSTNGLTINASTGAINPSTSTAGTYTVTYTFIPLSGSCYATTTSTSTTTVVSINPVPIASLSYLGSTWCNTLTTGQAVSQIGTAGGTYSASPSGLSLNASTGEIIPSASTVGTYTVTYTLAASGGCAEVTTTSVTITAAISATISYPSSPWCNTLTTGQAVSLLGTMGGTYSASASGLSINASTGVIIPSASTTGTYTISYTIAAAGVCAAVSTTVTITAAQSTSISYSGSPFCKSLSTGQAVSQIGTSGGTYSASPSGLSINTSTGAITPSSSTAGTYTVTYTIAASAGCSAVTTTTTVTITAAPSASISFAGSPFCNTLSSAQSVTQTGITGGIYSSNTGLSINASTGAINPSSSTAGTYTVTYTIAASAGCSAVTTTTTVTITAAPSTSISYAGSPFCNTLSSAQSVTQTGTTGGIYSSTTGLSINTSTGTITPSASTTGTHTVTYTIAAVGGCAAVTTTTAVTITVAPSASISYSGSPWCNTLTTGQAVSQTGTSGGTYSASPSGLSINASSGTIAPSASSPGTYTVSYTMAASGGCAAASVTGSLNLTITPSSTNTTNTSAVGTYTWANNGLTYTSSGVYSGTTVNCVTQVLNLTITPSTSSLSLQVFLDGYYINSSNPSSMRPARYNNLVASGSANPGAITDVDIITVELRSPSNLNVVSYSVSPILQTNGSVQCVFPQGVIGASYYIVVKHRAAIPLWSANPVIMMASSAFSFANNAINAYSDGSITPMHTLVPSLFGIWLGELNDDGFLDGVDYTVFETDAYLSQYAGLYLLDGDLNGDAYVDASDFSVFDFNARLGSYEQRP